MKRLVALSAFVLVIGLAVYWALPGMMRTDLPTNSINQCQSWENPSTTLCYRTPVPSVEP